MNPETLIPTLGKCYQGIEKAHEGLQLVGLIGLASAILLPFIFGKRGLWFAIPSAVLGIGVTIYYEIQLNKISPCPRCDKMRAMLGLRPIDQSIGY